MNLHRVILVSALISSAMILPAPAFAHLDEEPINAGSELADWCKAESEARFVAEAKTPYNWTASHVERGNTLVVEGRWRVDGDYFAVECRIARGARREFATIEIRKE